MGSDSSPLAAAAGLGLRALAELLTRTEDGIAVVDAGRRFVYANPAACQMLGHPFEHLRGRDFLDSVPAREHAFVLTSFHLGLSTMAQRAEAIGADLAITSSPGAGTEVTLSLPRVGQTPR
jgi:PAS domain-containing protein